MHKLIRKNALSSWLKTIGLLSLLVNTLACQTFSQSSERKKPTSPVSINKKTPDSPTPAKGNKKMSQEIINALRQHDESVLEKAHQAPPDLPSEIEQSIGDLDAEARNLAVELVKLQNGEQAGMFLLRRTADSDVNVCTLAALYLSKIVYKPRGEEIAAAIPKSENSLVRGTLYLEVGKGKEKSLLEELRRLAANEDNEDAKLENLAARVKLGGQAEKSEFLAVIRETRPDHALRIRELILYTDNPSVAKGLIAWLGDKRDVTNAGNDYQVKMARMCDVAIWTANDLKIKFPFDVKRSVSYTDEEIEAARKVLELLPN